MKETLLLVEDEAPNRNAVKRILRHTGLTILEAENGKIALDVVEAESVDLILLDIGMPVMDGYAFLENFKEHKNNHAIPVCMMTAWTDSANRRKAIDLGADDFIAKPVDRTELETRVKSLLRIRGHQKQLLDFNRDLENTIDERTQELKTACENLEDARQETEYAYHEAIMRLAMAAEYKDKVTAAHIQRMSHHSELLAIKCGWSEEDAAILLEAAKMHDIGKIGIPDAILKKPGKLTEEEYSAMKKHSEMGAAILSGSTSSLIQMAEEVALYHHEKFDGTGYPQGLAGEKIPELGRIVAIADVFDALMTVRPYKEAWPIEKVYSVMKEGSGSQFDPVLLELFLEDQDALLEIHYRYNDEDKHESYS